jgi:hypothetical protein
VRAGAVAVTGLALLAGTTSTPAQQNASLPRSGIAIQTSRGVDLVSLEGRVLRALSGYRIRVFSVERPGQVELRDRSGRAYEVRAGILAPAAVDTVTLVGGYALRLRRGWTLLRAGKTVQRFPRRTYVELDDSGTVLTSFRAGEDGRILTTPVARNLRTGARYTLPLGCRVGVHRANVRFELCGYPWLKRRASTIVRVDDHGRRTIAWPALRSPHGPAGSWQSVTLSTDGRHLLAQWSGECEIPLAYTVDARTGRSTVLGRDGTGGQAEGLTLGWLRESALVLLPQGACGSSAEHPGVYAFDRSGRASLIYRVREPRTYSAALWR